MRNSKKKSWLVATTLPMKKPTAMLVWNRLMTMVPPMHNPTTIMVDQRAEKDSALDRVDTVQNVVREMMRERARMEYHHPAINFRDEPPQRLLARYVVKCDNAAPMVALY
mmetsp:Transcript_26391/g.76160  ORF Transcript_26391/g.76160 Transcript_26391/m.76160 type:complete len:110 (+) Transcript_26391:679-1008(+)